VNRPHHDDTIVYLARATVFNGQTRVQGFGTDASKYGGTLVDHGGDMRLQLLYEDQHHGAHEIKTTTYAPRVWKPT
jgi:hypothetical protein